MATTTLFRPHGQAVKTSPFHGGNRGPNPLGVIFKKYADVAQLAEQLICNQQVIGSSPIIGFTKRISVSRFFFCIVLELTDSIEKLYDEIN